MRMLYLPGSPGDRAGGLFSSDRRPSTTRMLYCPSDFQRLRSPGGPTWAQSGLSSRLLRHLHNRKKASAPSKLKTRLLKSVFTRFSRCFRLDRSDKSQHGPPVPQPRRRCNKNHNGYNNITTLRGLSRAAQIRIDKMRIERRPILLCCRILKLFGIPRTLASKLTEQVVHARRTVSN
jgi:hypothetical protein